jgi:hypothetical protein
MSHHRPTLRCHRGLCRLAALLVSCFHNARAWVDLLATSRANGADLNVNIVTGFRATSTLPQELAEQYYKWSQSVFEALLASFDRGDLLVYCRLYCQILYNASRVMKIPKTIPLMVAASYSLPAAGSIFVEGYGWKAMPPVSLLYLTIFASSAIFCGTCWA